MPGLFPVLKKLQRRFGIRRVRLSKNIYGPHYGASPGLLFKKNAWNTTLRHYYRTSTSNYFTSVGEFYELATTDKIRSWIKRPEKVVVELMAHPGNWDEQEEELLKSEWAKSNGFDLISFHNI